MIVRRCKDKTAERRLSPNASIVWSIVWLFKRSQGTPLSRPPGSAWGYGAMNTLGCLPVSPLFWSLASTTTSVEPGFTALDGIFTKTR